MTTEYGRPLARLSGIYGASAHLSLTVDAKARRERLQHALAVLAQAQAQQSQPQAATEQPLPASTIFAPSATATSSVPLVAAEAPLPRTYRSNLADHGHCESIADVSGLSAWGAAAAAARKLVRTTGYVAPSDGLPKRCDREDINKLGRLELDVVGINPLDDVPTNNVVNVTTSSEPEQHELMCAGDQVSALATLRLRG